MRSVMFGLVMVAVRSAVAAPEALLIARAESGSAPADGPMLRARAVDVNASLLSDPQAAGTEFGLALFDDAAWGVRLTRAEAGFGGLGWTGELIDAAGVARGTVAVGVADDAVVMGVWHEDGRVFEVRPDAQGCGWVRELEQNAFAPCGTTERHSVRGGEHFGGVRGLCSDTADQIDVMIVYTPTVRAASGGTSGALALANSCISSANSAYAASGIQTRLRLAYAGELDYAEGEIGTDLSRLRNTTDGWIDEVHTLRNDFRADMVAMLSDSSGACGLGYLMANLSAGFQSSAFTVTEYTCAVGNLTFAHELGHNMGCAHDRDNSTSGLFAYSFGHRWISTNGRQYRSVMAYTPGTRVPLFSNPDILYIGTPTGVAVGEATAAHNAQTINLSAATIASFRQSGGGNVPVIGDQPDAVEARAGSVVELSVSASGDGDLAYTWYRSGVIVTDGDRISGSGTGTLRIDPVNESDAGSYTAVVSNPCGSVPTAPVTVSVLPECPADFVAPFGVLDFFDVSEFLFGYIEERGLSDLAPPFGVWDFFDISQFLSVYNTGCP